MKSTLLTILFGLQTLIALTQEPYSVWGEVQPPVVHDIYEEEMVLSDASGTYIFRTTGTTANKRYYLIKYSYDFKFAFSKDVTGDVGVMGNSNLFQEFRVINGKFYFFSQSWNKNTNMSGYNVREISKDGEVLDNTIDLASTQGKNMMNTGSYTTALSPDESKLVVLVEPFFEKKTQETITVVCYDTKTWTKIYEKSLGFSDERLRFRRDEIAVNNNGSVVFYKFYKGKSEKKHYVCSLKDGSSQWNVQESLVADNFLYNHRIVVDQNQNFILTGFFSSNQDKSIEGTVFQKIDANSLNIGKAQFEHFSEAFLSDYLGKPYSKGKKAFALDNFKLLDVFSRTDGKTLVVIEQQIIKKETDSSQPIQPGTTGTPNYLYEHNYNNIITFCFSEQGAIEWTNIFVKHQFSKIDDGKWSSTKPVLYNDELIFVLNDVKLLYFQSYAGGPQIEYKKWDEKAQYHGYLVRITKDGKSLRFDFKEAFKNMPFKMNFIPTLVCLDELNELVIKAEMLVGKRMVIGRIKI